MGITQVDKRIVCWFSCGAASAVAAKLAIVENGGKVPIAIVRIRIQEEDTDNDRFAKECENWFGLPILEIKNPAYASSIYDVFAKRKYIAGIQGASCTMFLKKETRKLFQEFGDLQVFGFTKEENDRLDRFIDANNDVRIWPVLQENNLTHSDCIALLKKANIEIPRMYKLGYKHNNCIGCVKGGAGYWNKIRKDFPEQFVKMANFSELLGVKLIKHKGRRIFLKELPINVGNYKEEPEIECGIFCEAAERKL